MKKEFDDVFPPAKCNKKAYGRNDYNYPGI